MADEDILEIEALDDDAQQDGELPGEFTFTANGNPYEVVYSKARVKLYEQAVKRPLMTSIHIDGGGFAFEHFKALIAYGIKRAGGGYVAPKQGMQMAERLIEQNGYGNVYVHVMGALSRDCGFLFK